LLGFDCARGAGDWIGAASWDVSCVVGAARVSSYAARRSGSRSTSAASLNIRNWPEPEPGSNLSVALRQAALTCSGVASWETPRTSYQVGLGEPVEDVISSPD
jgi:hypothetical protein